MALEVGTRLGHYDVTALIGEGGMGQVYQATDTTLNRQVALKILPEAFASDPDRLARFQREAQVLASLNHPNIAAIYGVEESGDTRALVLELVEGPTLADRIAQGAIPIDEALPIAKQIAEALEAAHEAGVIHRDLKPANIKVRDDGTVKVLDFGLAKALDTTPQGDPSLSPTLTAAATQMGVIMGTAAYMSPEQARGRPVDKRADIWAFGCLLYEMVTGKRAFQGEDVSMTLSSVLQRDPDWAALPAAAPLPLRRLLSHCLQKDRKRRLRDIGDAITDLDPTLTVGPGEGTAVTQQFAAASWAFVGTFVVGAALAGVAAWAMLRPEPMPVKRFAIVLPQGTQLSLQSTLASSPDGQTIVFVACEGGGGFCQAYRRPLDEAVATAVPGAEGAADIFFSPDGLWLGVSGRPKSTWKVPLGGGSPFALLDGQAFGSSWAQDNTIVSAPLSRLVRVSADGGEPQSITTTTGAQERWPHVLPGGRAVIFAARNPDEALSTSRIVVTSLNGGDPTTLVEGGLFPRFSTTGHIVFARESSLWAVPFDPDRLEVIGSPVPVLDDVQVNQETGVAAYTITADGSLVYASAEMSARLQSRTLVWVDRSGQEEPLPFDPAAYDVPRVSPDGTRVAVDIRDQGNADVWVG